MSDRVNHVSATEQIIRAAIDGGFSVAGKPCAYHAHPGTDGGVVHGVAVGDTAGLYDFWDERWLLLQREFWIRAGRSLGWFEIETNPQNVSWLEHWHRMVDRVASGGTPEDYFAEILGK
jgi:hypothetical protein